MHSPNELLQLCRLCLVKDQVDIPIFDGDGDIRQIFHKISTCLPVKVSQDDNLPKKVCDDCSQKLDAFYIFWNKSSNSERQLLQWLSEASSTNGSSVPLSHSITTDEVVLKQEIVDIDDNPADGIPTDDLHVPTDSDYLQSFASEDYELHQEDSYNEEEASASSSVGPSATVTSRTKGAPQRKRKAAAMKSLPPPQTNSDEEDDVDAVGTKIAKTEKQSDDEGDNIEPSTFLGVPIDNEQPGPSGLDKAATDTPFHFICTNLIYNIEDSNNLLQVTSAKCNNQKRKKGMLNSTIQSNENNNKTKRDENGSIGEEPFQCDICGQSFKFVQTRTKHRRVAHPDVTTPEASLLVKYDCLICKKHYASHTGLRQHKLRYHNTQSFDTSVLCDICGKSLSSKEKLKFHQRAHTGYKPFKCQFCSKTFSKKDWCTEHEVVHTKERKFACKFCGKGLTQRSSLKIHERTHTGEKPYICRLCKRGYISKASMDTHMKMCDGITATEEN